MVGGQLHAKASFTSGKTRYPLYRRLDGPQDRSGRVRSISRPPGFDPRTAQHVASRCTDWAIPAHTALPKLVRKFSPFYGTRSLFALFATTLHLSLFQTTLIQSMPSRPISVTLILILSSLLPLRFPRSLLPFFYRSPVCTSILPYTCHLQHLHFLDFVALTFGES